MVKDTEEFHRASSSFPGNMKIRAMKGGFYERKPPGCG
jgi:hypothetical protein